MASWKSRRPVVAALAALVLSLSCSEFVLYDLFKGPVNAGTEPQPLSLRPAVAAVYVQRTLNFVAEGGSPAYTYRIKPGCGAGAIDPITGVYTAPGAASTDTIEAWDLDSTVVEAEVMVVEPAVLQIAPASATISSGAAYQFSSQGGLPPLVYSLVSGGGAVDGATGLYSSSAYVGGATVRVADSRGQTSDATISVVAAGTLAITPCNPVVEEGGTLTFSGQGGSPPYSLSLVGGSPCGTLASGVYTAGSVVGPSDTVRIADSTATQVDTLVTVLPARPQQLIADGSGGGPKDIVLSWVDASSSEDGFRIERKIQGEASFSTVVMVGSGATSYTDSGLAPNVLYVYRVVAYDGAYESPASNEAYAMPNE